MPIYEYECENCCHRFELKQSFNDTGEATCPRCDSKAQRVFSPVPVIFKGSGFYVTDVKGKEKKEPTPKPGTEPEIAKS